MVKYLRGQMLSGFIYDVYQGYMDMQMQIGGNVNINVDAGSGGNDVHVHVEYPFNLKVYNNEQDWMRRVNSSMSLQDRFGYSLKQLLHDFGQSN